MRACIEQVSLNRVSGWAYSDNAPVERLSVSLLINGQLVAEARAENFRPDLRSNGLGDGCYGYAFNDLQIANIPDAFLAGHLEVLATDKSNRSVPAAPAPYLRTKVEFFLRRRSLETRSLLEFLSSIPSVASLDRHSAEEFLNLQNASRAHFPEWSLSIDFIKLALELAHRAEMPYSILFYEHAASFLGRSPGDVPPQLSTVETESMPNTYGCLREWVDDPGFKNIRVVEPRFFDGGRPGSFLNDVGILRDGHGEEPPTQVLAFREHSFGESTWWVARQGRLFAAARNLYYLDFELLRSVVDQSGFLLIDMSNEGPPADPAWIDVLNRAICDLRIDPRHVILIVQNLRFGMGGSDGKFIGHIATAHFYISKAIKLLKEEKPSESDWARHCSTILSNRQKMPDESMKHYICLNFTPRWPRWATVLHLSLSGLLPKGHVSFPGRTNHKLRDAVDVEKMLPRLSRREELVAHVPEFVKSCPLELDVRGSASTSPDFIYPIELTTGSLLHIVTETEMSDGENRRRVTEKILKPIVGLQPFVVVGNPSSLALMRDMGFRTFDFLIDESYDRVADPASRIDLLFQEIDRLTDLPIESLRARVDALSETLIHNFLHLMSVGPLLFNDAVGNRLRKLISLQETQ